MEAVPSDHGGGGGRLRQPSETKDGRRRQEKEIRMVRDAGGPKTTVRD